MTPDFQLFAGGEDRTAAIRGPLVSLSVTDEDGYSADRLELEFDDRDGRIAFPETNIELELRLGFCETGLVPMGLFAVDRVSGSGMPRLLSVTATAVNMTGAIRAPRSRAWRDVTLGDIVGTIAASAGLQPVVFAELARVFYPFEAQTAESDLNFLLRLAARLDATAKPAGGRIVVVPRDRGVNAEGTSVPPLALGVSALRSWSWDLVEREAVKSVSAEWGDIDAAERPIVMAGDGEPSRRLRHIFAAKDEAQRAVEAELAMSGRRALTLEMHGSGFMPSAFAGGWAEVSGLHPGVDGRFLIRRVDHRLDGALTTTLKCERSAE